MMQKSRQEATLLSLVALGVVFGLGIGSFSWGTARSVVGAVFVAALTWPGVYAVSRRSHSSRE